MYNNKRFPKETSYFLFSQKTYLKKAFLQNVCNSKRKSIVDISKTVGLFEAVFRSFDTSFESLWLE